MTKAVSNCAEAREFRAGAKAGQTDEHARKQSLKPPGGVGNAPRSEKKRNRIGAM
jgi:hypothetical protein